MRNLVTAFVVLGSMSVMAAADGQGGKSAPGSACSLLSPAEVKKIARPDDQLFDNDPEEEKLGKTGSACMYSGVRVQLDPFPPARLEELRKTTGNSWVVVPDVGDAAYFHHNTRGGYAEVYARAGQHVVTVQLDVWRDTPVESIRPAAIALAKALVAKLR